MIYQKLASLLKIWKKVLKKYKSNMICFTFNYQESMKALLWAIQIYVRQILALRNLTDWL